MGARRAAREALGRSRVGSRTAVRSRGLPLASDEHVRIARATRRDERTDVEHILATARAAACRLLGRRHLLASSSFLHEGGHFLAARAVRREGPRVHARPARSGAALPHARAAPPSASRRSRSAATCASRAWSPGAEDELLGARAAASVDGAGGSTPTDARRASSASRSSAPSALLVTLADYMALEPADGRRGQLRLARSRAEPARPTTSCSRACARKTYRGQKTWKRITILVDGRARQPRRRRCSIVHRRAVASGAARRRRSTLEQSCRRARRAAAGPARRATRIVAVDGTQVADVGATCTARLGEAQAGRDRHGHRTCATAQTRTAHATLGENPDGAAVPRRRAAARVRAACRCSPARRARASRCTGAGLRRARAVPRPVHPRSSPRRSRTRAASSGISRDGRAGRAGGPDRLRVARRAAVAVARRDEHPADPAARRRQGRASSSSSAPSAAR